MFVKYVEPPDDRSTKMSWNAVEIIWTSRVVRVENPKPLITMEENYTSLVSE